MGNALEDASIAELFDGDSAFDHVVVTASSTKTGSVRSTSLEDANASMNSKFFGAYRVARAARIAPGGSLTFVSGLLSRRPSAGAVLQALSTRPSRYSCAGSHSSLLRCA